MPEFRRRCGYGLALALGLLLQLGCSQAPATGVVPYEKSVDFDLSGVSTLEGASITISNQGADAVSMPSIFLKNGSGLNRPSVLASIEAGGSLTDEQFALNTWKFVVANAVHYCYAGAPGDTRDFALEPMRLFHGFGFLCCDQSSRILIWLWQGNGYQTRIAQMSFHTVPEIFYKNAWHMYDADHKVYYPAEDNQTVASVAEIIADPSLVARVADSNGNDPAGFSAKQMAALYAAAKPSYFTIDYSKIASYSLQPGQSFTAQTANTTTNIFHGGSGDPISSTAVDSGKFDWGLDFSQAAWSKLASSQTGVSTTTIGANVFLTNSGASSGNVVYSLSSPFPVFNLGVSGLVDLSDSSAAVNVYFSTDGTHWSAAFPIQVMVGGPVQGSADLSSVAQGQYSYFVKIELSGNAGAAGIAAPHIVSLVQDSTAIFPKLVLGTVNHLTYQDWNSPTAAHDIHVSLNLQ